MKEHVVDVRWLEPPEPLERVIAALDDVAPEDTLRVLIHREPLPLYAILARNGYEHETRALPDGTYEIVFRPRAR